MKLLRILTHPIVVIALFCLTLVSGKHLGGVYLLYLLMAIPHGASHAILAIAGMGILLLGYFQKNHDTVVWVPMLLSVVGVACLFASLFLFFRNSWHYNADTFSQPVPIATYILFGSAAMGYLLFQIIGYQRRHSE